MLPAELLLLQFVGPSRPKPDAEWDLLTVICLTVQYLAFCFYCFFNCVYGVHRRKLRARCKLISERNETSIKNLDSIFVICAMHIFQQTFQSLTYKQHILTFQSLTENATTCFVSAADRLATQSILWYACWNRSSSWDCAALNTSVQSLKRCCRSLCSSVQSLARASEVCCVVWVVSKSCCTCWFIWAIDMTAASAWGKLINGFTKHKELFQQTCCCKPCNLSDTRCWW